MFLEQLFAKKRPVMPRAVENIPNIAIIENIQIIELMTLANRALARS